MHEQLLRDLAPRVLGRLIRRYRDFAGAEDSLQEAMLAAALQWPRDGAPENPGAWLLQAASRRMVDRIRSDSARRERELMAAMEAGYSIGPVEEAEPFDDTLALILMCCHPSLAVPAAIALTLRAVGGLTTAEIARAFLVPEATMAQRISRAKQSLKASGARFEMPAGEDRTGRIRTALHVLYLMFNEGYAASGGDRLQRVDLALEAMRLARLVLALLPGDPEVMGLLALMLLTDARRLARTGAMGEPIPLDRQDRDLWDREQIAEGIGLVEAALSKGEVGPYQLQAAIAAVHDQAVQAEETDWRQILALYDLLARMSKNAVVRLNRAVAVAMVRGAAAGLEELRDLDPALRDNHRLYAVRAHLLERCGEHEGAIENYQRAAAMTLSLPERHYLLAQSGRLREGLAG